MPPSAPPWAYDDRRQIGLDFEDEAAVAAYDRKQGSDHAAMQALARRLDVGPGRKVIEFGCGTGAFSRAAAKLGATVEAVDVSTAMMAFARRKAVEERLETIEFHHAGFLTYCHQAPPADLIVSRYALHHLPDHWKQAALLRMAEMLATAGQLYLEDVIFSFDPRDLDNEIGTWIKRMAGNGSEGFTAEDFATHVREEHSTYLWILEGFLKRAGFRILERQVYDPIYTSLLCDKL